MGLVDEYERIEQGRLLWNYKDTVTQYIQQVKTRLDQMIAAKVIYPEATAEIDALVLQAKNALTNLANQY